MVKKHINETDVTIVGAGMVGLALANTLAQADIRVELIEMHEPNLDFEPGCALRVSALNISSRDVLQSLGVWESLRRPCVEPFSKIEAWTQSNNGKINFNAADIGKKHLAYVVENREIVRVLWEKAVSDQRIVITIGQNEGDSTSRRLTVGADGAQSAVRQQAGIEVKQRAYGQQAIVAMVHSAKPHNNSAYQNFLTTGPLGVLPLYDPHLESIVWSADEDYAHALMQMSEAQINIALSNALDLRLGKLTLKSERILFPLIMRHAQHYVKPGVALVGDAAHTIHPLAGQGVNLGFKDVMALSSQLIAAHKKGCDLGAITLLRKYERERKFDTSRMLAAMQLFRSSGHQFGWGFGFVDQSQLIKRCILHTI